jgi:Trypsin-like serine proteases, typically periplasmic, contain C-terminal PDZ domain
MRDRGRESLPRRVVVSVGAGLVACLVSLHAAQALGAASLPDFSSYVSREESIVVSIATVTLRRRAADGADEPSADEPIVPDRPTDIGSALERHPIRKLASGLIVSSDGHILTSAHGVSGARELTVRLADGREFVGRLLGSDDVSDVALVKIEAQRLPEASLGNPDEVGVGDWVSAIGSPFGLDASVTAGIVSAKRLLPGTGGISFIQTDVAVNPGSSGSPLFNLRGQVIGINSMVYTMSGGYQGVSFALPIDVAMGIARQLRAGGRVVRGELGLSVQEVTPGLAQAFGLQRAIGAIVVRVARGGTADVAGMRVGDIVLGVGDAAEMSYAAIQRTVEEHAPGTRLVLAVWRDRMVRAVAVEVTANATPSPTTAPAQPQGDRLGIVLAPAQQAEGRQRAENGVEVREAHGMALRAGIAPGDRILSVNETPVRGAAEYRAALERLPADGYVALLVLRDGALSFFALGSTGPAR